MTGLFAVRVRAGGSPRRTGGAAAAGDTFAARRVRARRDHHRKLAVEVDPGGADPLQTLTRQEHRARRRDCGRGSGRGVSAVAWPLPGGSSSTRRRHRAASCGRPRACTAGGCNLGNRNAAVSRDLDDPPGLAAGDRRRRAGGGEGSRGRDEDSAERRLADRHPRRRRRRGAGIDRGKGSGSVWTDGPAGDAKVYGAMKKLANR